MPFGLASAAAVCQRIMQRILQGIRQIMCFQDDILVYGSTECEHNSILREVFKALDEAGMTIRKEKCQLGVESVEYLGHKISKNGVEPKCDLVVAVKEAPAPTNKEELRSFLGLAEFKSKFVHNLAVVTAPMRTLLKKNVPFEWNDECQIAFEEVKDAIVHCPTLGNFDPTRKTWLTTDASGRGLGATLSQCVDGQERIVAFASKSLREAELKYSTIEREALACFWAINHFKFFLWGLPFLVRTDHKPLISLFTVKGKDHATPRIAKWIMGLEGFNFDMQYVPGKRNILADCLSRLPRKGGQGEADETLEPVLHVELLGITKEEWVTATNEDRTIQTLKDKIRDGWPERLQQIEEDLKGYWEVRSELHIAKDLVMRGERIIPPQELWEKLIGLAHEGHLGRTLTKNKLRASYWFPTMDKLVENTMRECVHFALSDKTNITHKSPLSPVEVPTKPWDNLWLDILGPLTCLGSRARFIFVLVDYHTHWVMTRAVHNVTTQDVTEFLKEAFTREGIPSTIVTDNGVQFTSGAMVEFLRNSGVQHFRTALYNPKANGLVERVNRMIKECFQLASISRENLGKVRLSECYGHITPRLIWSQEYPPSYLLRVGNQELS
ncbi:hypothetical protein NDU88_001299 [Pleurodeles waltl]|uniref:Gypsy retrotransposon integrase-like protein 1 n=1 Tax=Pleurodeles waltl TaxID=8319 RepID=A0AAV7U9R2_PLEWA|nr:hypothetical protein NDU88_001299 [Pleurodeles waltl]